MRLPDAGRRTLALLGALLALGAPAADAAPSVTKTIGVVQIQGSAYTGWKNIDRIPYVLTSGDQLRTGSRAQVSITFDDGSRVELGPDATFDLEDTGKQAVSVRLNFGDLPYPGQIWSSQPCPGSASRMHLQPIPRSRFPRFKKLKLRNPKSFVKLILIF